jgi:hypothetical protein
MVPNNAVVPPSLANKMVPRNIASFVNDGVKQH